jgi:anti-anti-sigma factor
MQGEGVSVEHLPEAIVVSYGGELDLARVDTFNEALEEAVSSGREVQVDLGRCTFIDSSGLRALIRAFSNRNGDAGIAITEASPAVRRVLELVGVDGYVSSS